MFRLGALIVIGVCVWAALFPSADSRAHPTAFLENSVFGQTVLQEVQNAQLAANALTSVYVEQRVAR